MIFLVIGLIVLAVLLIGWTVYKLIQNRRDRIEKGLPVGLKRWLKRNTMD